MHGWVISPPSTVTILERYILRGYNNSSYPFVASVTVRENDLSRELKPLKPSPKP